MIVPDVNLLLHAVNAADPLHERARPWLEQVLGGDERVGLSWSVLVGFIRISTRPGVFASPLPARAAFDVAEGWLARSRVSILEPTSRHMAMLRGLVEALGTGGNILADAHLAALAIEHGGIVASRDHDFGRFKGLKWVDPLAD